MLAVSALFFNFRTGGALVDNIFPWITSGEFFMSIFALRVDALSAMMILVITGVGFLIHVYSTGYMADDEDSARYFCLSQFVHRRHAAAGHG